MKENKNKKLVLLDAHAIIHRAYHALPDFATSKGEPTGALYGLVLMVLKIVTDLKPDYIVACFDLPKPTYRHEVYEGYKAGRTKTDGDLVEQLEKSKQICEALNIPMYSKEGFEADDMLGTITEQIKDIDIVIASGDMDTMQLVRDAKKIKGEEVKSVKVYTLKKGIQDTILYDEKGVLNRFGFEPKLLPDYKGLRGDPSDNIIGIQGIGEKTATDLIVNFGTIENIYKVLKKDPKILEEKGVKKRIIELLKEGEEEAIFSKMLATIRRDAPIDFVLPKDEWHKGLDTEKANEIFTRFEFRTLPGRLAQAVASLTGEELEQEEKIDHSQNIDKDVLEETKVALWVVDSNITDPTYDDILNFAKTDSFDKAREYIFSELKKRESEFIFESIEKPIIDIVSQMQKRGIKVDTKMLSVLSKEYKKELKELEQNIWKEAGQEFNISSPKQLGHILFDVLGIVVKNQKKTGSGAKSTKESELQKMKYMHPIVPFILEYRELSKIIGTYIDPIPKMVDDTGRLHARFVQTGTTTGRMSSEDPNLQNIPVSSEKGKVIRNAFLAEDGFTLMSFDYSQIELRIAAFLSKDETLIDIFKTGDDVHTSVASVVFNVSKQDVTKDMRRQAKVINFGILYGMGVNALAMNLGSDRKTAQSFYNAYFEKFSSLALYIENTKLEAEKFGYTKTVFGRRRYFEGLKSSIPYIRASAERMAINAPIQGTQADIIKISMNKIDQFLKESGLKEKVYLLLQIHDELIYEVKDEYVEEINKKVIEIMESVLAEEQTLGVPIIANCAIGKNWGELK